ncbi:MAG: riboflavin biosynthesis protein RibF [Trueperaceae bacterium]
MSAAEPAGDAATPHLLPPPVVSDLAAAAQAAVHGAVVSVGNFDGVHLGHRALLGSMRALASARGAPAVVVTFFPPAKVFFSGADYLSTAAEKLRLLAEFDPQLVVMLPFDQEFSQTPREEFMAQLAALRPSAFVVGADFRFGRGRLGSVGDLADLAPVEPFELVSLDGEPVGSSRVREMLAAGRIDQANRLLGAPYMALGTVVEGAARGHTIGFPTANLQLNPRKALPQGVYAVTVDALGATYGGMANVGPRPTFPDTPPSLEVHLFDFDGDLYGRDITVRFVARLRGQMRFGGLDELKAQLAADALAARLALNPA